MEEHVLHDPLLLPLNLVGGGALLLQELVELRGQVEQPSLSILRGAGSISKSIPRIGSSRTN